MTKQEFDIVIGKLSDIIKGTEFEGNLYVVGGACRSLLLGLPIKDIDIVLTMANGGIRFAEYCKEHEYTDNIVVYPTYGTAMFHLKMDDGSEVEIECVHTRKEWYFDRDSRNPTTEYGTIEDDSIRRDLTINAIYYNVSTREFIDPTGKGIEDIKNKRIRVTSDPDKVFYDDALRILRCIRFMCVLGWKDIDKETYDGLIRQVDRLEIISKERINEELRKILISDNPRLGLEMLRDISALKYVMPTMELTVGMEQNKYHFGDVFEHTLAVVDKVPNDYVLRMAAFVHDIGKPASLTIDENGKRHFYKHEAAGATILKDAMHSMKYPTDFINGVVFLVKNHMRTKSYSNDISELKDKQVRKMQYFCHTPERFENLLALIDADNKSHAEAYIKDKQIDNIRQRSQELVENGTAMFDGMWKMPVDGHDIMRYMDIPPSSLVQDCLGIIRHNCYADPHLSKEAALRKLNGKKKELKKIQNNVSRQN